MRRLYSTFAGGVPGIGLLLMRLVVGLVLFGRAGSHLWREPLLHTTLASVALAAPGLLLVSGLWTPVAGGVVVVMQMSAALGVDEPPQVGLLVGTIGAALAMLGPGRWSVDAWLFGWRRIEAPARRK